MGTDSLYVITLKRTLRTKSIWICLLITVLLSLTLTGMERKSDITLNAVVYAEDEELRKLLAGYEGLVHFEMEESEEKVKDKVLQNKAECGYVIGHEVPKLILSGEGQWCIPVYENSGATMTDVVNEVLFERVFYYISTMWYEEYLSTHEHFRDLRKQLGKEALQEEIRKTLYEELHFDRTFGVNTLYVGEDRQIEEETKGLTFYPGRILAVLCVLICALIGLLQVITDRKEHRIYKHKRGLVTCYTILHPTLLGTFTAILIFLC